tara:strand:+ start:6242 stop:7159 length:918 start_codon:yes stop_codon:yes gene_type:complete
MISKLKKFHEENLYSNSSGPLSYVLLLTLDLFFFIKYSIKTLIISKHFKDTKALKDSFKNKNAFVLANGPSLKKIDLEKIKQRQKEFKSKVICVNSFIGKLNSKLIPDFYVLSDPVYFGLDQELHTEETLKEIKIDLELIEKNNITLFIPLKFKNKLNIKTNVYYFNDIELRRFNKNIIDITRPRGYLSMTAYKALSVACYLGFKKIYIAGFDNDYFKTIEVDKENRIYYKEEHYIEQGSSGKHLFSSSEGLKQNQNTQSENLGKLLLSLSYLFSDLDKFPKNIINLNEESLIDSFKKEDIFRNS